MKDVMIGKVYCLMARCVKNGVEFDDLLSIFSQKEGSGEDMSLEETVSFMNKLNDEIKTDGPKLVKEYYYKEMDLLK